MKAWGISPRAILRGVKIVKNDVVIINLDRPRELRYGHKALKTLVAMTGKTLEEIETAGFDDLELVEKLTYCGLLSDAKQNGETLNLNQMEDFLDCAPNYKHIIDSVTAAFAAAFGANPEGDGGNDQQPAAEPADGNSTSKKA
jgi:hypothetical protein